MVTKVLCKGKAGEFEEQYWEKNELFEWLKSHIDEKGNVNEKIVIFEKCSIVKSESFVSWVFSDYSLDRDKERINPNGWKLDEYKANPVVLWGHDRNMPAIGKATNPRIEKGQLVGEIEFDLDDPFAKLIAGKVEKGFINSGSVGFMPNKIKLIDDKDDPAKLEHEEQTLYEFSIVNVPSNMNARRREIPVDLAENIARQVAERMDEKLKAIFGNDQTRKAGEFFLKMINENRGKTSSENVVITFQDWFTNSQGG